MKYLTIFSLNRLEDRQFVQLLIRVVTVYIFEIIIIARGKYIKLACGGQRVNFFHFWDKCGACPKTFRRGCVSIPAGNWTGPAIKNKRENATYKLKLERNVARKLFDVSSFYWKTFFDT